MIDSEKIKQLAREFIIALGDNPDREGVVETPNRVAKMCQEVFAGMNYTNHEIAQMFNKTFKCSINDLVIERDIPIFSFCEHHLALMYNMRVHIAYVPNGRVIGLSKLARIADIVGKRLQLQEKICSDIADILVEILDTENVAVIVEGEHSCMSMRGIRKTGALTQTTALRGLFKDNGDLRKELYSLLSLRKNQL